MPPVELIVEKSFDKMVFSNDASDFANVFVVELVSKQDIEIGDLYSRIDITDERHAKGNRLLKSVIAEIKPHSIEDAESIRAYLKEKNIFVVNWKPLFASEWVN